MKLNHFLPILAVLFFTSTLHGQIEFREGSWEEILAMAEAEGKPVFVDAFAVWCGPCKMMDKQVFTQSEVGDFFNEHFINAKIDMEKGEGPGLAREYKVTAYPTLLFVDEGGNLLHRAVGMQDPGKLINTGKMALRKVNHAAEYGKRYEAGEREPEFILEYLTELRKAEKSTEKVALEYIQNEKKADPAMKARIAFEGLENIDSKLFSTALEGKEYLKESKSEKEFNEILKEAARNTMKTAIQFDSPELFQQAVKDLTKMEMDPGALSGVEREYYAKTGDEEAYRKNVEKELKTIPEAEKSRMAMDIYEAFPQSKSMLEYARGMFDEVYPDHLDIDNLVIGLSLGIGLEDEAYMDEVLKKMKEKEGISPKDKTQAMSLHMKAKRYLAMKTKQ